MKPVMKPEITVVKVHEERITTFDFPVTLTGYDPYTDQFFEGEFNYFHGLLKPISYEANKGKKLSPRFLSLAMAFMKTVKEDYDLEKGNK